MAPNWLKSISGGCAIPWPCIDGAAGCCSFCFTNACISSFSTRSLGPVEATCARSTPSSRANIRTAGPAWAALLATTATPSGATLAWAWAGAGLAATACLA